MSPERLARRVSVGFTMWSRSPFLLGFPWRAREMLWVEMSPRLKYACMVSETRALISTSFEITCGMCMGARLPGSPDRGTIL
jgi:hypothetical protein